MPVNRFISVGLPRSTKRKRGCGLRPATDWTRARCRPSEARLLWALRSCPLLSSPPLLSPPPPRRRRATRRSGHAERASPRLRPPPEVRSEQGLLLLPPPSRSSVFLTSITSFSISFHGNSCKCNELFWNLCDVVSKKVILRCNFVEIVVVVVVEGTELPRQKKREAFFASSWFRF
jgi:hypothetical protein